MNSSHRLAPLAGWLAAVAVALCLIPAGARADVHDNAHLFTQAAVDAANATTGQFEQKYKKQFVIETFASAPADGRAALEQDKAGFFKSWMSGRAKDLKVNGVYALICMDPKYVEAGAGTETREKGIFTKADLDRLREELQTNLKAQQYDAALAGAVDLVDRTYTANIPGSVAAPSGMTPSNGAQSNGFPTPSMPSNDPGSIGKGSSMGIGALLCVAVGLVIIFSLVRSIFRRNQTGGFGGGGFNAGGGPNYPTGGPNYGPGYGQGGFGGGMGGGGGGGGGGGIGRGFLGGLLGGAVGGYAADKFEHRNDPNPSGGANIGGGDAGSSGGGFGGGGGTFDSGPSDAGSGFGDAASGGDFGGGGGDSGGGGGGGGDSGGGF
jgi:hypothetical protein